MTTLAPGTRIGPYEIVAALGAGGMGEVYRARDTRLGRDVAIKTIPPAFAQDVERLARFEREARLLASLNHPNIGAIYGLEEQNGQRVLVLELIDGETLAARIARGRLTIEEALDVCRQVAAALESAHESGIVHRDLKPGNVMLASGGGVKVLDFGLARGGASGASSTGIALTESPTMSGSPTMAGAILGTAAYMSPEQARGRAVDKRTDIWSFGCVLYECLTGRQCFEGETVSDLIASILQTEPDWNALPARTPERIRELLRRCLEKDARKRLRDIGDARIEIEDVQSQRVSDSGNSVVTTGTARPVPPVPGQVMRLALVAAVAVGLTLLVRQVVDRPPPRPPLRFEIADAPGMDVSADGVESAISPDGSMIALVGNDTTRTQLWVRSLSTVAARPLAGTEGAIMPFWSPDSRHIGFFTESQLKRVDVASGTVDVLCDVKRARGGTWNRAGQIVFAPASDGGLDLIPASGGDVRHITTLDHAHGETGHRFPMFLPDGKHFLFSVLPPQAGRFEIDIGSIDTPKREKLVNASSGAVYAPPGRLLYARGTTLVAQTFDPGSRRLKGDPVPLREAVAGTGFSGGAAFSVSDNGMLAYATYKTRQTRVAWMDLDGREIQRLPFPPAPYGPVSLSPDRRRAVFMVFDTNRSASLWIGDLERGTLTRFSDEPDLCEAPQWSPDGTRIAYFVSQQGPQTIVVRPVDGSGPPRRYLADDPAFKELCSWSPDSQSLLVGRQDPVTRFDMWVLPLADGTKPWRYLGTPFNENSAQVSPDGKWACYLSDETGRPELYIQSFPKPGPKYQVTTGGGLGGGWPRSGGVLLYGEGSTIGSITAADVLPGESFKLGPPRVWARLPRDVASFDVAPGEKRLLVVMPTGKPLPNSITVVVNWPATLTSE